MLTARKRRLSVHLRLWDFLHSRYFKRLFYYMLFLIVSMLGVVYGYFFSEIFFESNKPEMAETIINAFKLLWLVPLPYALLNYYSFIRYPVFYKPKIDPIDDTFENKLYFRYVTRGLNETLVDKNVKTAYTLLQSVLPNGGWVLEVVTDNPLAITLEGEQVHTIVVPGSYRPPNGSKFKARALQYALSMSTAVDEDWIIHLDEETQFDEDTVRSIYHFANQENEAVTNGSQATPRIGQGVILYGARQIVNWWTTFADSIRVGDDYGRFRLQFEHGKAYFGMHGSYIVVRNSVEKLIGLDHGPAASITEDAYFALIAQSKGIEFAFIHGFMYERSPFSMRDFVKQRQRWFGGLWLCARDRSIPIKDRFFLYTFMILWSLSWLCILMVYVNLFYPTGTPAWLAILGGVTFSYYVCLYIIGFLRTFRWQDGKRRFIYLLILQIVLLPLFSAMEAAGVLIGLIRPPKDFYIVKKEFVQA